MAVRATEESKSLRNDIYDHEPMECWAEGNATLLGDAAHPMAPNLGQGACQAIEDAEVLGRCLKDGGDVASSLRLYESHRVRRTGAIVKRSRSAGWVVQLENPLLCGLRDTVARKTSARTQLRQLESVVKYEA